MADRPPPSGIDRTADEMQRLLTREPRVCPVCQFVALTMAQHVDHLFFERVTDVATRVAIRNSRGFCRNHARLVSRQADALGTALIMQDILVNELLPVSACRTFISPASAGTPPENLLGRGISQQRVEANQVLRGERVRSA